MSFDKIVLQYYLRDSLSAYSEDFALIDKSNPYRYSFNGQKYSIHTSFVHDSGNHRPNPDENRIQISRRIIDIQNERKREGFIPVFLGFFEDGKTFVAWEPSDILSRTYQTTGSAYARQWMPEQVAESGISIYLFQSTILGRESHAIALSSELLGFYLDNINLLHSFSSHENLKNIFEEQKDILSQQNYSGSFDFEVEDKGERKKLLSHRKAYPRDPKFKRSVIGAYNNTCCVCGKQLGLIQAAHIIPHCVPDSPNSVKNGLALCIEHHRLYDDGLLLPAPSKKLYFNEERAEYLRSISQGEGLDEIKEQSKKGYSHPEEARYIPDNEFLKRGLNIRIGA